MAWKDSGETLVGNDGLVYVADVGTALPTNATTAPPVANWTGLGYHNEDGATINKSLDIVEHRAWQSSHPIRRSRGEEAFAIAFGLLQWNEINVPLAFGGGSVDAVSGGQYKYTPPEDADALLEKSLVLDVIDGSDIIRFIVPKGTVTDGVESQFARDQMSPLPITFQALEPDEGGPAWYFFTNRGDFAAGS